jgi:hypothetical protein
MTNDITGRSATDLSAEAVNELLGGILDSRSSTVIAGGRPLMRLLKSGVWVFGQQDEPVQLGSEWAINPKSIQHGWSCWTNNPDPKVKNELLGEHMAPIRERKPLMPEPVRGNEWKEQRSFDMMCVLGDDEGVEVLYKTSSVGGMRGVDNLLAALIGQLRINPAFPVAIVQLGSTPYDHAKFGQIFNPIFTVVDWATMGDPNERQSDAPAVATKAKAAVAQPQPQQAAAVEVKPAKPAKPVKAPITKPAAAQQAEPAGEEMTQAAAQPQQPPPSMRPGATPRRQRPEGRV